MPVSVTMYRGVDIREVPNQGLGANPATKAINVNKNTKNWHLDECCVSVGNMLMNCLKVISQEQCDSRTLILFMLSTSLLPTLIG